MAIDTDEKLHAAIQAHHESVLGRRAMKLHVEASFHARVKAQSEELGVSMSDFMEYAVDAFMTAFLRRKLALKSAQGEKPVKYEEFILPDPESKEKE